jgi:hypothetical protein
MSVVILQHYPRQYCMCTKVQPGIESVFTSWSVEQKAHCVRLRFACSSRMSLRFSFILK